VSDLFGVLRDHVAQSACNSLPTLEQQFSCVTASWRATLLQHVPNILIALVVLVVALLLDDRVQRAVERLVGLRNGQRELARLLGRMARAAVLLFALLIIVSIFQLTAVVTSFVASLGIVGLVLAFALQDITKNFAAGVLLLILRPFRLDDRIKVKDFEGVVTDISLRATSLLTSDGEEVLVPNADVYGSPIVNLTRYPRRRYHIALELPATLPVEPVRQRLEAALRELPGLERDPAPEVVVTAATGATLTLDARYWLPSTSPEAAAIMTQAVERLHGLVERLKAQVAERDAAAGQQSG
jgi:small-conductance mechanosensitive channel